MKIRAFLGILIVSIMSSCTAEEPINREYLQSQQYLEFKETQEQEFSQYVDDYRALKTFLSAFGDCPLQTKWDYPLKIDNRILHQNSPSCKEVSTKFRADFSVYPVGYSLFDTITVRWFKVNKTTGYQDIELIAATYKNSSLISFKTVGLFQENLSKNISTSITVENYGGYLTVKSIMQRGIKYPFEYDNVIQTIFKIDTLGIIKKEADQINTDQQVPKYLNRLNNCEMGERWRLPIQLRIDMVKDLGQYCHQSKDSKVQSIGYTRFEDILIRLFSARKASSAGSALLVGTYHDGSLISFQTVCILWQSSSRGVSAMAKIYQQEDFVYISNSIEKTKDYPIREKKEQLRKFRINDQGSIQKL